MEIKVSTLSENTALHGYIGEYGLSLFIEAENKRILFDTGLSFSAYHNAQIMGIDLTKIDCIVLSHGHLDHTGGLAEILRRIGKETEVIAHPDVFEPRYTLRDGQTQEKFIGLPYSREELENRGAHFTLSKEPVFIAPHIMTTGEIPMLTEYEKVESNLHIKDGGNFSADKIADDLSLIINTEVGPVVFTGCGHRGVINILFHARKLTGNEKVYAVIGGIHLYRANEERIQRTISEFKLMGIQKLGVSHCTGFHASAKIAEAFPEGFFLNNAGNRFILP
ncbi:MAG TPA: MBL fold metallo-hydrolase [Dehalococcoidia bacterium]|nr:MBL fold metallo-hydrolase [Dehalococcoidia bacterium]HAS27760.1 MBL fold metallo-hydrolase [Dehalococcoidia bacterium]